LVPLALARTTAPGGSLLLAGGDKAGNHRWYETRVPIAAATGGTLEIRACFPDGEVRITQFKELEEQTL